MSTQTNEKCSQKTLENVAIAFKILRVKFLDIDRQAAGMLLACSAKNVEKHENGRGNFTEEKVKDWLEKYNFSRFDFDLILEGKIEKVRERHGFKKAKVIDKNTLRRSYKKIVDKRVLALICIRKLIPGLTQYKASGLCGYPKCTIGHIENGRIELSESRVKHIVTSYGRTMDDFNKHLNSEKLVIDLIDECILILKRMPQEKILAVHPMLISFGN